LTDFCQTFVTGASWDTDDLITFLVRKVKGQGHHRGGGAQHSTLLSSATFSSFYFVATMSFIPELNHSRACFQAESLEIVAACFFSGQMLFL